MREWMNVLSFSVLIWVFIPFLLASKVFTTPEFMERRFSPVLRQFFAIVTVISNIVAFLAAVLYGGGLALARLFPEVLTKLTLPLAGRVHATVTPGLQDQWNLWLAIIALGVVAGSWAIYGGLKSVAWTDFFTVIVMLAGGTMVTILGLYKLSEPDPSLVKGWEVMIERNQANAGVYAEFIERHKDQFGGIDDYNRLSVIQPITHPVIPWPDLVFALFSISIWYNVINQFMIQRVLGAKNMYHARMGIVLAGYMKVFLPFIIVVPGLIFFAMSGDKLLSGWDELKIEADQGYIAMLHDLIPAGLTGLFLAALFGAIQSTVNSVLNSTATICTLDIYKRVFNPGASQKLLVRLGMVLTVVLLVVSMALAGFLSRLQDQGLFVYIQALYAFFAPPFSAVFLLGILWRRINGFGATVAVVLGFAFGLGVKVLLSREGVDLPWLEPFAMQAILNWLICMVLCVLFSLISAPPAPEQVTDELTINWRRLNLLDDLGHRWYASVWLWWALFVLLIVGLILAFSGTWL
jgi:SSS family solute:Na+ symporter